jgi:hypothetical protein
MATAEGPQTVYFSGFGYALTLSADGLTGYVGPPADGLYYTLSGNTITLTNVGTPCQTGNTWTRQ